MFERMTLCVLFMKSTTRPIVGLPLANSFTSVCRVLKSKIVDGKISTKAKLRTRGFKV